MHWSITDDLRSNHAFDRTHYLSLPYPFIPVAPIDTATMTRGMPNKTKVVDIDNNMYLCNA